jgi:hypothetical protein
MIKRLDPFIEHRDVFDIRLATLRAKPAQLKRYRIFCPTSSGCFSEKLLSSPSAYLLDTRVINAPVLVAISFENKTSNISFMAGWKACDIKDRNYKENYGFQQIVLCELFSSD